MARASDGAWLALAQDDAGIALHRASSDARRARTLPERTLLIGPGGAAALPIAAAITSAAGFVDGSDGLHLAWTAGDHAAYARCPSGRYAAADAWHGPMGEAAPSVVAAGLAVRSAGMAAGARPVVAGERGPGVAIFRFDGEWRETFASLTGRAPALARDAGRGLHLAHAAPDGVRYASSVDGTRWLSPGAVIPGGVQAGPSIAVGELGPVIAAVVDGRGIVAAEVSGAWRRVEVQPPVSPDSGPPLLTADRYGTLWCVWPSGGRVCAARWLGERLAPAQSAGEAPVTLIAEIAAPEHAPDLGLLGADGGELRLVRLPVPAPTTADEHPVRFLDLREVASMEGIASEGMRPGQSGALPPPAPGELLPGSLVAEGPDGKGLRAWFSRREGEEWVGYTARWSGRAWGPPEPLRLSSPRPWLQPPSGALAVIADDQEPSAARRYKMAAERAGPAPALLTSADGIAWTYYAEAPRVQPFSLLRDPLSPVERRWQVFGRAEDTGALALVDSPDQQHWYPGDPPCPGLKADDAAFWVEEGRVLGLVNGGRTLLAGDRGGALARVAALPELGGDGRGRLLGPPLVREGRRRLFTAAPDAWRWAEAPAGRWIALRAAGEERPGVCATVPIALTPAGREGLLLDVRCARSGRDRGGVGVELLNAAGALIAGRRARVSRGDGWVRVVWERGKDLWDLDTPAIRLRFTIEPGARLYGFRFAD